MYEQIKENIENIASNFDNMMKDNCFMKEKITNFYFPFKFKINFDNCHVAISKNGGLIAICKKANYLNTQRYNKLNNNVIVMNQNARNIYTIPISWNYNERWIICFDFTENGKLFGICNDGTIYKFDILTCQAREQITSDIFKKDKIVKAKFFERGFIALTYFKIFYYVKEFKNIYPIQIFQLTLLEISGDVDFIGIPPSVSSSGKFELIFTNEKGNGVIHVIEQPKGFNYMISPTEDGSGIKIDGVSVLENNELEPYTNKDNNEIDTNTNVMIENNKNDTIGNIVTMAISPKYKQIALYNKEGIAYIFSTKFDKKRKEAKFIVNNELSMEEQNEINSLINFDNEYQFLFCGEDAVAISGQRFILISNTLNKTLTYKIEEGEEMRAMTGGIFCKCISEVDGLRFASNNGIFFISKVNSDLYKTCYPFINSPSKELLKAYINDLMKDANSYNEIKNITKDLSKAVSILSNASANIFWTEDENAYNKKEIQLLMLKGAQFGKNFIKKEECFNYDAFVEICRNIRIVNELRNNKKSPIFITYKEFIEIPNEELIKIIMSQLNYKLAFIVSKYLEYNTKKIYQKWACSKIKKLKDFPTKEEQINLFNNIMGELNKIKKISYIKLAKKAFKYKKNDLGMKFLELEKSILAKIPHYITHKKWNKALELAYETFDSDIIATVLNEIINYNQIDKEFINQVKDIKNIKFSVIDYIKKNNYIYIENYLDAQEDYEELLLLMLEYFFNSNKISEKKKYIKLAKEYQKKLDKNHVNNKFYLLYLKELENSLVFKKNCIDIEGNIIKKNNIEAFDNSIYDCYKQGVKENKFNWIEGQNKNYELSPKKMAIMKIRAMAENGKILMVDKMIKESSLKKLNLTPLNMAELYFDYNQYDLAVEYIRQINNADYFDYKVEMLLYMEKYEDAIDIIISSKNMDRMPELINEVLMKKPSLKEKVKELCTKYKVNLS